MKKLLKLFKRAVLHSTTTKKIGHYMIRALAHPKVRPLTRVFVRGLLYLRLGNLVDSIRSVKRMYLNDPVYHLVRRINAYKTENLVQEVIARYSVQPHPNPSVSIIIPVHNHVELTLRCLLSIFWASDDVPYEIIVADDSSEDDTPLVVSQCKGLIYIRNEENLGYLKTCNKASKFAKGEYLLFLNNDTLVLPGWLTNLVWTFQNVSKTGLVGSKLLYPNSVLQEAGGIVWSNGDGWNFGRGDNPHNPKYSYLREVDYCSGACIMVRHDLWKQLGGFDERYAPAYYEDTDLAFRVREAGFKVLYQPLSQVIHLEGASSGRNLNAGVKQYQLINREKFYERWKDRLNGHGAYEALCEPYYYNRYVKGYVLYIDAVTPTPDRDSGSIDAVNTMKILRELGYAVTFIPAHNLAYAGPYTEDLQRIGVECLYLPFVRSVEEYIRKCGSHFSVVILSRYPVAKRYISNVRKYIPNAKIMFNTVDLHFLREERSAIVLGDKRRLGFSRKVREEEINIMRKSDYTLLVSEREMEVVQSFAPEVKAVHVPPPRQIPGRLTEFEDRKDIAFIGGYRHLPNVDAVWYFAREIWPSVSRLLPGVNFLIVGSEIPKEFQALSSATIKLIGYVPDIGQVLNEVRLSVAPLRFGAGIKGKILTSLSYGVPCVASTIAIEGMGLTPGVNVLHADSREEFIEKIVQGYTSPRLWYQLSDNGLRFVKERYSIESVKKIWENLLRELK